MSSISRNQPKCEASTTIQYIIQGYALHTHA